MLYPNIYVLLCAGSASARKSSAINIGLDILTDAFPEYPIFGQRGSVEALIKELHEAHKLIGVSASAIINDEFITFLGGKIGDKEVFDILSMLTKLYDCPKIFKYKTIARGAEVVVDGWCTILGGLTPDQLKAALPAASIGGGFTSRLLIIYQERSNKRNARPVITPRLARLREALVHDLQMISSLTGEMGMSSDAESWYVTWYEQAYNPDQGIQGMSGYFGRKHDILTKLAMLLSASTSERMVITEEMLESASSLLGENEKHLPALMGTIMSTGTGEQNMKVLRIIEKRGTLSWTELLRNVSYCMNALELTSVIETLLSDGHVEEILRPNEKGIETRYYRCKKRRTDGTRT